MHLAELYRAIDRKPFQPFFVQLTSGEKYHVSHSDNIFVLPNRHHVIDIEIFNTPPWGRAMFGPEAVEAILYEAAGEPSSS